MEVLIEKPKVKTSVIESLKVGSVFKKEGESNDRVYMLITPPNIKPAIFNVLCLNDGKYYPEKQFEEIPLIPLKACLTAIY